MVAEDVAEGDRVAEVGRDKPATPRKVVLA